MKVFLSWSGPYSKVVALELKRWLPRVLPSIEPFMSETDITPGSGWLSKIIGELRDSQVGVICLTPDCVQQPWLNFEAGALTRELRERTNLVIPYLHQFEAHLPDGPLAQFQAVRANKEGTLDLLTALNGEVFRLGQFPIAKDLVPEAFDLWWPKLKDELDKIPKPPPESAEPKCTERDYSFFVYGKGKVPRMGPVFQDFETVEPGKKGNVNPVHHLWADSRGGKVEASIIKGSTHNQLRVKATTTKNGVYPCNVGIRGKDESPLLIEPSTRYLVFGIRLAGPADANTRPVSIAVRIVNGMLQHWSYATGPSAYICEEVREARDWTVVSVDLHDPRSWYKFDSDGNPGGPPTASFETICSVVLELGRQGANRPDSGGTAFVDIGPLVVLANKSDYGQYVPRQAPRSTRLGQNLAARYGDLKPNNFWASRWSAGRFPTQASKQR